MVHPYISPYTVWCGGGEPAVLENILDSSESVGDASLAESSIHGGEEQGSGEEESSERNQQGDPASNMADADTAEMTAEQLRAEVMKARQERDNKKVQFKTHPPSLDDCPTYVIYKRKLKVWKSATCLEDRQQAALIMNEMRDDHKIKKDLSTLMYRTLTDTEIENPTTKRIEEFLDEQLNLDEYGDTWNLFKEFIETSIKPGEKYEEFTARFDSAYKALVRKDGDCSISNNLLAMFIRYAARLPTTTLMSVRSNVRWKNQDKTANKEVYTETIAAINEICAGELHRSSGSQQIKMTTAAGEVNMVQYKGESLYVNNQPMITAEQHEMLMAEQKKKLKPKRKQAKKAGATEPNTKDLSKVKCYNCQQMGHYRTNCPELTDNENHFIEDWEETFMVSDREEEVDWTEEDMLELKRVLEEDGEDLAPLSTNYDDESAALTVLPSLSGAFYEVRDHKDIELFSDDSNTEVTITDSDEEEDKECFVDTGKWAVKTFTAEAEGAAGLDSCCSRTIMGINWFRRYKELLPAKMKEKIRGPFKTETNFLFGDGGRKNSQGKYVLPLLIHDHWADMVVELVDSDIPMLIGKPSMIRAGVVLDFVEMTTTAFGVKRAMRETTIGHPIISVMPAAGPRPFIREPAEVQVLLTEDEKQSKKEISVKEQKKIIHKVHKQVGHPSKEKMIKFLNNSSYKWTPEVLRRETEWLQKNCEGCILKRRSPCKPAASIPAADGFNQVVGVDLKVYGDGGPIILYVIDVWSKLMQARVVRSKKSEHIVEALLECWVAPYGVFQATIHDNGGEFIGKAFTEMVDMLGIEDRTGAAHSPWSYGIVEKHHAVVDKTFESLRRDFPSYSDNVLLQWALAIKNATPTSTGFSPAQVVFGKNPVLPSLLEANPAMLREEVLSESLMKNMNALNSARVAYNEALADVQVKRMLKAKLRRNQTVFQPGDFVYWKVANQQEDWRQGKVLATDGKLLFVKAGSQLYRVHTDMTVKKNQEYDKAGKLITPKEVLETQARLPKRPRQRRRSFQVSLDESDEVEGLEMTEDNEASSREVFDDNEDGQPETAESQPAAAESQSGQSSAQTENTMDQVETSEVPTEEAMEEDITLSDQNYDNGSSAPTVLPGSGRDLSQVSNSNEFETAANSQQSEEITEPRPRQQETLEETLRDTSRADNRAMIREEMREQTESHYNTRNAGKATKRKADTDKNLSPRPRAKKAAITRPEKPKSVGEKIKLGKGDSIFHMGKQCTVLGRAGTARGNYYNYFNLQPVDGTKAYSVDLERSQYTKRVEGSDQEMLMTMVGNQAEVMMETIPYHMHGNQECVMAKKEELDKIVNQFKAVRVVKDVGQFKISCRFVLWYKKHSSGEVQTRARLVARGYEEEDDVPSDSPTLDQLNLKLIMMIAQSEGMKVVSADVKAAFLQGLPLTERTVTVIPPPEAKVPKGYVWELVVALYGLDDASLRFHWKVRQVMKEIGMKQSRFDPSLFYMRDQTTGRIKGMIGTHVDDFIMAGSDAWLEEVTEKIKEAFMLGKVETENFLYCGHRVRQQGDSLTLDQEEFARDIKPLIISPARKQQGKELVTEKERSTIRAYAGKLGWLGRTTRPDLLIPQIRASSTVTRATVNDMKELAKAVSRIPQSKNLLTIPKLPQGADNWKIEIFTDAAWHNLEETGSTGGKVILIKGGGKSFPITWSANRIKRVCHSSMAAEILAMNEGLKDGQFVREVINEMTGVEVKVELVTDCKNAYNIVQATTAPQDKSVKCLAAGVRESYLTKEVEDIKLVSGKTGQLADCLTKLSASSAGLLAVVQTGEEAGEGRD